MRRQRDLDAQPDPGYDPSHWPRVSLTVDLVVLTIRPDTGFSVLLVERGGRPFKGYLALPGGFVFPDERILDAARRELQEETGIEPGFDHLEQLATYGDPGRDSRDRVVSVAYLAFEARAGDVRPGGDAAKAMWHSVSKIKRNHLAFDHGQILADGLERARNRLEYTTYATAFLDSPFTMTALREVYEAVWDVRLDPRNFHRKVTSSDGFVIPTGEKLPTSKGRSPQLYAPGGAEHIIPPMRRSDMS